MPVTARPLALAALLLAGAAGGRAAPVPADVVKADKARAALAARLCGAWVGGDCEGRITLRPDGTYEWTGIGPVGNRRAGTWAVRGPAAGAVLVLKCTEADNLDDKGAVTELEPSPDGAALAFTDRATPTPFERAEAAARD